MTLAAATTTWILVILWPDGSVSQDPATTLASCEAAVDAWIHGRGLCPWACPGRPSPASAARGTCSGRAGIALPGIIAGADHAVH